LEAKNGQAVGEVGFDGADAWSGIAGCYPTGEETFNEGNRDTFSAMKVPRQCPLVLLVKVD
jgi:hypothetical protein